MNRLKEAVNELLAAYRSLKAENTEFKAVLENREQEVAALKERLETVEKSRSEAALRTEKLIEALSVLDTGTS